MHTLTASTRTHTFYKQARPAAPHSNPIEASVQQASSQSAMFGGGGVGGLADFVGLVKEKGLVLVEESKALAEKLNLDRLQEEEEAATEVGLCLC